jgi:hypothetical protein
MKARTHREEIFMFRPFRRTPMKPFIRRLVGWLLAVMICLAGSLTAVSQERYSVSPGYPASFTAPQGAATILLEYETVSGIDFEPRFYYNDTGNCEARTDHAATLSPSPQPFSLDVLDTLTGVRIGGETGTTGPVLTIYDCGCPYPFDPSRPPCAYSRYENDQETRTPESREIDIRAWTAGSEAPITVTAAGIYAYVIVAALRPATFAFGLNSNLPDQKILTHKYRSDDAYPLATQLSVPATARPQVKIEGVVNVDGSGATREVWFRLIDPPDKSAYIPVADRIPDDNKDTAMPRGQLFAQDGQGNFLLNPDGTRLTSDSAGVLKTTSRAPGGVTLVLEATDRYAGDNYQIEASFDEQFTCATAGVDGANNCVKSAVYVTWKRVYIEAHKMFQRGAFLTREVVTGDTIIRVSDVSVFPNPPFVVRLIHGADADGGSPLDFYHEEVTVRHLQGRRFLNQSPAPGLLSLRHPDNPAVGDTIQGVYDGLENVLNTDRPYLADAVGLSTTASDYMTVDTSLVAPLFDDAFVEFVWLTDERGYAWSDPRFSHVLPFVKELERGDGEMTELLGRKWMRNAQRISVWRVADPNHQMLFLAHTKYSPQGDIKRGDTRVSHAFNDLWLYTGATPNTDLRAEALTHELGHEWLVNQFYMNGQPTETDDYPGGHCDLAFGTPQHIGIAANSSHLCEMTSGDNMWATSEARDRRVGFHYLTLPGQQIDSEYLHIRRRAEPVPQNDNPRTRVITQ